MPRIINNRSLVKLFCQIYTHSRGTEGLAGAAAAPLDRSIHHGVQMAELQEVSSGAGPGCVSSPRPSPAGDSAGSEHRRLRDALGAGEAAASTPQLSLPPPAATRGPGGHNGDQGDTMGTRGTQWPRHRVGRGCIPLKGVLQALLSTSLQLLYSLGSHGASFCLPGLVLSLFPSPLASTIRVPLTYLFPLMASAYKWLNS